MGSKKREFELLELDAELLRELPEQGAKLGLQNLGATVKHLKGVAKFEGITADQLSGRLRSMKEEGYTVDVTVLPVGDGRGWQRTAKGKSAVATFDAAQA